MDGESLSSAEALPPTGGVTWRAPDLALGVFLALLAFFIIGGAFVYTFQAVFGLKSAGDYLGQYLGTSVSHVAWVGIIYFVVRRSGGTWLTLGFRAAVGEAQPITKRVLGLSAALSVIAHVLVVVVVYLQSLTGYDFLEPKNQLDPESLSHAWLLPIIGLSVVVTAPIAEELVFRGFIFAGLRRYWPLLPAALLSGLLFSAAHASLALLLPFMLVGAMFAVAYERTHSIYVPMLTHFFFNLVSYLVLVFVGPNL